ncbi:hypothetical protein GOP47_0021565 [Adiantum capillus-veneris]|uniref:RAB6-interacting golgin n=1 Tax=Adiantum capillus-veneris TaxID=13818 RepID=A0A9D4U8M6_ADICA|nr:hypothetical protein GOP47_0021565 [Adiantum capillus-veneris]
MASFTHLVPQLGPDGIAMEHPAIAYTEKVLEEKELELKRYIQDNYSKIRNVEKELASLAFEIKLTAGPKKAALEHLRKKIELSAEKIKVAKQREEQAKKVWEAAAKALKDEEENKQKLCEDLNRLVQESAASQYSRLEELKKKLEALNPEVTGGGSLSNGKESLAVSLHPKDQSQQEFPKEDSNLKSAAMEKSSKISDEEASRPVAERVLARSVPPDGEKPSTAQQVIQGESRNRNNVGRPTRGRSGPLKGQLAQKTKANSWTGAGFDVDDRSEANN